MQTNLSNEQNVDYAINDAEILKKYALNTLGVIDENIFFLRNATSGQMNQANRINYKDFRKRGREI